MIPTTSNRSWDTPAPLPSKLKPPDRLTEGLLPGAFRRFAVDIAERMQVPLAFVIVPITIMIATLIGRKVAVRPKRLDDWLVIPNLWGMTIGRPGIKKTQSAREALGPLYRMESEAHRLNRSRLSEYEALQAQSRLQRKQLEGRLRNAKNAEEAVPIMDEVRLGPPPTALRYVVNDPTVEKLAEILRDNPVGVLVTRDELSGSFYSWRKAGRESERQFYLEGWDGNGCFTVDRIGRGTIRVEHICLSMFGTIQPSVLGSIMGSGLRGGAQDDGMLQRFQLAVWPDPVPYRRVDRAPDLVARHAVQESMERLSVLAATDVGAKVDEYTSVPHLQFESPAQEVFDQWFDQLEQRLRSDLPAPFESHLAKYRSLVPSLALVYHLGGGCSGPISFEAVIVAIEYATILETHARRIYSLSEGANAVSVQTLARRILSGSLNNEITVRNVYRKGWKTLGSRAPAESAVEILVNRKWLRPREIDTNGRPKTVYEVNPLVRNMATELTMATEAY